jgi:hypothetical protein
MSEVSMKQHFPVPASQVWQVIGNFHTLQDWHPMVQKSESAEGGTIRRLTLPDGSTIEEKLQQHDNNAMTYSYGITKGNLPFSGYSSTIRVIEDKDGKGCTVEWGGEFTPAGNENEAIKTVQGLYEAGLKNLQNMFGGK